MKLGTVHRGTVARARESTGSGRVPSGYRLLEKLEDDDRWGRRLWKAEGPGGTRAALVVLEPANDTRPGGPLSEADGERMAALALDDFRSVSHPHLLPVDGTWWMHGAMVVAYPLIEESVWSRYLAPSEAERPSLARGELFELLGRVADVLDHLAEHPRFRGHRRLRASSIRLAEDGIRLEIPPPVWWPVRHAVALDLEGGSASDAAARADLEAMARIHDQLRACLARGSGAGCSALLVEERAVLERARTADPQLRWPSCAAFVAALRAVTPSTPPPETEARRDGTPAPHEREERPLTRASALTIATATGITAVAATLALTRFDGRSHGPIQPMRPRGERHAPASELATGHAPIVRIRGERTGVTPDMSPEPGAPPAVGREENRARAAFAPPADRPLADGEDSEEVFTGQVEPESHAVPGGTSPELAARPRDAVQAPDSVEEANADEVAPDEVVEAAALQFEIDERVELRAGSSGSLRIRVDRGLTGLVRDFHVRLEGLPRGVVARRLRGDDPSQRTFELRADREMAPTVANLTVVVRPRLASLEGEVPSRSRTARLEILPSLADAARLRGEELLARGDHDAAVAAFTECLRIEPENALAFHGRGMAHYGARRHDKALADFDVAARSRPNDAPILNNRGLARLAGREYDLAILDFEAATRLDPTLAVVHYNLGRALLSARQPARAVAALTEAIERKPAFARALRARGDARVQLGDRPQALADFDRALALEPNDFTTLNNRGLLHLRQGEAARAVADFDKAIHLEPRSAVVHYNRGRAFARLGNLEEAVAAYSRALELEPGLTRAYSGRASVHGRMGRADLARADLERLARETAKSGSPVAASAVADLEGDEAAPSPTATSFVPAGVD